jgi:hypothetical protein
MTPTILTPPAPAAIPVAAVAVPVPVEHPVTPPPPPEERELYRFHTSMGRRYPLRCAAYLLLIASALVSGVWALSQEYQTFGLVLMGIGVVLAVRFAFWAAQMGATALIVTNRRVILQTGVLLRHASEFPIEAVNDIQVDQTLFGRLVNVGDLVIISQADKDTRQMVVMALPNPLGVAEMIRAAKGGPSASLAQQP